jgi:RNA polymerase sigma-70 factor (ECF subfamily)
MAEEISPRAQADKPIAGIVEPHLEALYRAGYRLCRNRPDAEDLVQDVCLRAHAALRAGERICAPRAWLLKIQYRIHVDRVRRESYRRTETYDDEQSIDSGDGNVVNLPEAAAATAEAVAALGRAWGQLNSDQQALLAYYAEGYSLAEITEISGLPMTALKARLHRARVRLGRLIQQDTPLHGATVAAGETT